MSTNSKETITSVSGAAPASVERSIAQTEAAESFIRRGVVPPRADANHNTAAELNRGFASGIPAITGRD